MPERDSHPGATPAKPVQAKLVVGAAHDPFEIEADRVADQVMARLARRDAPAAETTAHLSRIQRSTTSPPAVGVAGGVVEAGLESRIQRLQGRGQPLPTVLRSSMEGAFGAGFGDVRTHAGPEATALNRELGARAFTVGNDVVFGEGQCRPGTAAGQHLLAHELAHTLQQGGGARLQRKLAFEDTRWSDAKYLNASSGGGGGVLFVGEQSREVVVKPGEDMAIEGAMAAMLHTEVGEGVKSKKQTSALTLAPGLRVASPKESRAIKQAVTPLLSLAGANAPDIEGVQGKQFLQDRARRLVGALDQPGVVIQDLASGKEVKDALQDVAKHSEKKRFGGRRLRKTSPLRIFTDPRAIRALGATTAVDLFTGNKDRLLMYNHQNFMVTPYNISMIDNIWMGTDMSYFRTSEIIGHGGKKFTITADEGVRAWKADSDVKALATGHFETVSTKVFDEISMHAARNTRSVDKKAFKKLMQDNQSSFIKEFNKGLAAGREQLLTSLNVLMRNPAKLQKLVPKVDLSEILETMKKRKEFLEGGGA
jgi:hypothetical protein